MNSASQTSATFAEISAPGMPVGQIALLLALLGIGCAVMLATLEEASLNAVVLFTFVAIVGLFFCRKTQIQLNDRALSILGYFWLVKLALTIFLLYAAWMPQLDPGSRSDWGYDPQRYYLQARDLIDNNWSPDILNLNYVGILYYYAAIFRTLGHNPVIPALVNAFVTLLATLFLIKCGYEFCGYELRGHEFAGTRASRNWTLAFALLLPEILWYDIMTARETLIAALLLAAFLTTGRYLACTSSLSLRSVLLIVGASAAAIAAVRASMLIPLVASILLMALLVGPRSGSQLAQRRIAHRRLLIAAVVAVLIVGPPLAGYLGGYDFDIGDAFRNAISAKDNSALQLDDIEWSQNSIGALLMPDGLAQSVLFLPARAMLYLIAPLPNVAIPPADLIGGDWQAWQQLLTLLSSAINVLAIPYVLGSLVQSIRTRKENSMPLIFHISFWATFIAIVGGNLIIQERYRVMASLLLFGCAWMGATTCPKPLIRGASLIWYGLLACGALFYVGYKFILA